MNKISLPQFKGDPILLHAVAHSNAKDVIQLLEEQVIYLFII
jgi:hypothetical protein